LFVKLTRRIAKEVMTMLANLPTHTPLPVTDLKRAMRFYAEQLGLTPEEELPDARDGVFYRCGGTRFLLYPAAIPSSGAHSQMTWLTNDIEADVAAPKARGVVLEEYDLPDLKTVNGVATIGESKGAWFKDSEGNLLALGQFS
jgi:predicted enzyme related to lactoylglutathione lyase